MITDLNSFLVFKYLRHKGCVHLPSEWRNFVCPSFKNVIKKAAKEAPPGRNVLLAGVFQALISRDRSFIDKAVKLVEENLPEDIVVIFSGAVLCSIGYYDEGIDRLRRAANLYPSAGSLVTLAGHLAKPRDYYEKLVVANRVLKENPDDVDALRHAAFVLVRYGRLGEAESHLRRALELSPKDQYVRENLGEVFYSRGDYASALREYKKAARFSKTSARLWQQIACCYYFLGRFGNAKKAFLKMKKVMIKELNFKPDDQQANWILEEVKGWRKLGVEYFTAGFNRKAYPFLKVEASREEPPAEANLYYAAMETVRTKDNAHIEDAVKAVGDNISRDIVLSVSGRAKFEAGCEDSGMEDMKKAVELSPCAQNIHNLAVCLSGKFKSKTEAKKLFEQVLSQQAEYLPALWGLAKLANNADNALQLYDKATKIESDRWRLYYDIGETLCRFERFEEAVSKYEEARNLVDENPSDISVGIARCYLAMGDYQEALKSAERALVENPKVDEAKELLTEIKAALEKPGDVVG